MTIKRNKKYITKLAVLTSSRAAGHSYFNDAILAPSMNKPVKLFTVTFTLNIAQAIDCATHGRLVVGESKQIYLVLPLTT